MLVWLSLAIRAQSDGQLQNLAVLYPDSQASGQAIQLRLSSPVLPGASFAIPGIVRCLLTLSGKSGHAGAR